MLLITFVPITTHPPTLTTHLSASHSLALSLSIDLFYAFLSFCMPVSSFLFCNSINSQWICVARCLVRSHLPLSPLSECLFFSIGPSPPRPHLASPSPDAPLPCILHMFMATPFTAHQSTLTAHCSVYTSLLNVSSSIPITTLTNIPVLLGLCAGDQRGSFHSIPVPCHSTHRSITVE